MVVKRPRPILVHIEIDPAQADESVSVEMAAFLLFQLARIAERDPDNRAYQFRHYERTPKGWKR
jgi:hypothetical protein